MKTVAIGLLLFVILGFIMYTVAKPIKPPKKEYQKGYDIGYAKGHNDAVLMYIEKDTQRQEQFLGTMKRMIKVIENYEKVTKHIKQL